MKWQKIVNEYASNCAIIKKLEERNKELKEKLVPYLRENACPTAGPYLVVLGEEERTTFRWKAYAIKLAKQLFGPVYKRKITAAQNKAGNSPVVKLSPKVNPDWKE